MGTADELRHAEEPKDESRPRDTPVAKATPAAVPAAPARQGDPFGESRTREEFEPSVNVPNGWATRGRG